MSWIVQSLLRNATSIKSKIREVRQYDMANFYDVEDLELVEYNLDDDGYNNLLVIEKKIKEMREDGLLSDKDLELIEHVSDGKPLDEIGVELSKSRITLARKFYMICNRIAFALGYEFTDEGYLLVLKKKYRLTEEEVDKARHYMLGRYRSKIMRKLF